MESKSEDLAPNGCPIATQDITVNLKNRQTAIDEANYGPMIPGSPNNGFWMDKAKMWNVTPQEAKKARCSNCAAFIQTKEIIDCVIKGLGEESIEGGESTVHQANIGFCNIFDFKCAGNRTCDAWVTNGPVMK